MSRTLLPGHKIIAVDFDGTLCFSEFPYLGAPNRFLIEYLKDQRLHGAKIILYTCRVGAALSAAVEFCKGYGLGFDAINENLPEVIELFGGDTRKITADVYIDDQAVNLKMLDFPAQEGGD